MVSGTATVVEEGALEHINLLAKKYLGEDNYPYLGPGEQRVSSRSSPARRRLRRRRLGADAAIGLKSW